MTEIVKIDTHIEDAIDRLITQYKGKPNIEGLISSVTDQFQLAEDAIFDMIASRQLANAVGEQLDRIGEIVGVNRQSFDDDFYRTLLYVQIGKNTSQGNPEKIIDIFRLLTNATSVHYINLQKASIQLNTNGVIAEDQVNFIYDNMEDIVASGVRIDHIVCYTDDSFSFSGPNVDDPGLGFGDSSDANVGGEFPILHVKIEPFAFQGSDIFAKGFGSLIDPLTGGNLRGIGG